jgi:hypothetical protein
MVPARIDRFGDKTVCGMLNVDRRGNLEKLRIVDRGWGHFGLVALGLSLCELSFSL